MLRLTCSGKDRADMPESARLNGHGSEWRVRGFKKPASKSPSWKHGRSPAATKPGLKAATARAVRAVDYLDRLNLRTTTMKLTDIEEVTRLRNHREATVALRRQAECSFMELHFAGCKDPSSIISLECVRRAVMAECNREIENFDKQLAALGVEVPSGLS